MEKEIKSLMSTIINKGYEVYIVGGYVRDYLLNIPNDDYDLTTNMPLEDLKKYYPNLHIMKENNHRITSILHINNLKIEISLFKGINIQEDLHNRDFTINALALDINNNIIDINNYREDLNNKKLKLVKADGSGIDFDPLRILRAIRLSLSHNLSIDQNTKETIISKRNLLNTIAKERIYNEIIKILKYKESTKYIDEYKEIFFILIPELKKAYKFNQHNKYHIYDVFYHTLKVIDGVENNKYLKLAALFHDLGKPKMYTIDKYGEGHFYGHWKESNNIFKRFCKNYKVDKKTEKIVSLLVLNHDREIPSKRSNMIKYLQEFNHTNLNLLFKLQKADILAQNPLYHKELLKKLAEGKNRLEKLQDEKPVLSIKELAITGNDLIQLGYHDKEIGIIKEKILMEVINNQLNNDKESIIKYINNNI